MPTASEIAEFDTEELERQLSETRRELFNLRFQLATGQLDNFSRIRHVRKDVARMMTELRIREIAEAEGLALDEIPIHQAAARRRSEDEALGRSKTTAAERRAAARAEAAAEEEADLAIDEDELAEEVADDDGMPVEPVRDEVTDADPAETEAAETEAAETEAAETEAVDAEEKRDG
jgi:large subunit ribosomal protein L29